MVGENLSAGLESAVPRPLPVVPRGPGRASETKQRHVVLTCPRVSPEWELAARLALVKPKPYTKDKIAHKDPEQPWPKSARKIVARMLGEAGGVDFPAKVEHRMVLPLVGVDANRAKRLARKISRALPELWFVLDDRGTTSYLRDGISYVRAGKYKLELVRSNRVHLRRAVRFGFLGDVADAITPPGPREGQHEQPQ
jgi:hypothetical protein